MSRSFSSIIISTLATCLSACGLPFVSGSGQIVTESRQVSHFEAVNLKWTGELYITQGDRESLTIEADDNVLPYIKTGVFGNTLEISMDFRDHITVHPSRPVKYYLMVKDIRKIELSGSGKVFSDFLVTDNLNLDVSGSGDILIERAEAKGLNTDVSGSGGIRFKQLKTDELNVRLSGSGKTTLAGQAVQFIINISGSGNLDASEMEAHNARVKISGSGKSLLNIHDQLDIEISGSGDVTYTGDPQITQHITGSGKIHHR